MTPEGVKYLPWGETKKSNFRKPDKFYVIRDSTKTMNITGILKDTLKEESCVVLTTFSDFKKDDHKPGKSSFSEVSLIPSSPLIVAGTILEFANGFVIPAMLS